jgi:cytochrome c-type biogenesis protein CcmH
MMLWALLTVMCCLACLAISIPLIRRYDDQDSDRSNLAVYQSQLAELERDEKAGQISAQDAANAKTEVQRRMIATAKAQDIQARRLSPMAQNALVFGTGLFVALGAVYLYSLLGRPDIAMNPGAPGTPVAAASSAVDTVDGKIVALEQRMAENPKGWRMLGWAYFNTAKYDKSVAAYGKALALAPDELEVKSAYAEAQVMAANNVVTPAARTIFEEVLKVSPKDERARFYMSLALEQAGDFAGSLDSWLSLYADAPADAGWLEDVRRHAGDLAKKLGKDISAQLAAKPAAVMTPGPDSNPDAAAAIKQMNPDDQQAMIKGMVQRLADKLAANPQDAEGWTRLIHARMILKDEAGARAAYDSAIAAFKNDAATVSTLKAAAAADGLGLD